MEHDTGESSDSSDSTSNSSTDTAPMENAVPPGQPGPSQVGSKRKITKHTKRRKHKRLRMESTIRYLTAQARSKLPKKRRRVLPVEQPRRKRDVTASNRRVNAVKHPDVLKELPPGGNKFGVNGMNMISLALQGPPNVLTRPSTASAQPLQARAPIVESPIVNTQAGAISLASLQPPLMTAPPLQPRPATTGALDLMLPLQPKLLPGYHLQSSFLTSTLSTVRPPDRDTKESTPDSSSKDDCKNVDSAHDSVKVECENYNLDNDVSDVTDNSYSRDEINSNVIDAKTIETSVVSSSNDDSPNNNSH